MNHHTTAATDMTDTTATDLTARRTADEPLHLETTIMTRQTQTTVRPALNRPAIGRLQILLTMIAAMLLFTACNGGQDQTLHPERAPASGTGPSNGSAGFDQAAGGLIDSLPIEQYSDSTTRAVVVGASLQVFDRPDGIPVTTLAPTTTFGTTRVLLAEETDGEWTRVRLPARPNHRTGWIRSSEVQLETVDFEVTVDLSSRTLVVRSGLDLIMQSSVTIGSSENPTPTGTFYITDKLETPDPDGAYGPYAFGLSGYSETLTEFAGGDGQIGLHGTNNPDAIGQSVSHGCIRLPNELISELAGVLPLGTPVHIV